MPGRGFARAGARNQRLDPHHPHQPPHPLAVDPTAFLVEFEGHSPRAVEREFEMQFVDAAHHRQIVRLGDGLGAVDPRARHAHKRALAAHRQVLFAADDTCSRVPGRVTPGAATAAW